MDRSIINRIEEYLTRKGIPVSVAEKEIGISNASLSKPFKNGTAIKTDTLEKFLKTYHDIDPNWLLTGIIKNDSLNYVNEPITEYLIPKNKIPLVSIKAVGGFGNNNFSISEKDVKDYYVIPKFNNKKIDFMIEVEGSSMYPKYNSGDIVACRIINEKGFIQWNKTHVIATKDQGIIIKRIKPDTNDSLLMVSDNKDYDAFKINLNEIDGIALVVGVIRLE